MIKHDNVYLILIKILLPMIFILLSMYYLFKFSPNVDFIGMFMYCILLSYFSYNFYTSKHILFSKSKLGEELIIFSNSRPLNYKNSVFWAVVTAVMYAIFMNDLNFNGFEMINSQVIYFSFFLLVIIINFVILFQSMIESSAGIYSEGILIKKIIKWEEIIGYKIIKNKIYIKVRNRSLGFENNYFAPISNSDDLEVKNLLKENTNID